jgi:hypothetical protein
MFYSSIFPSLKTFTVSFIGFALAIASVDPRAKTLAATRAEVK